MLLYIYISGDIEVFERYPFPDFMDLPYFYLYIMYDVSELLNVYSAIFRLQVSWTWVYFSFNFPEIFPNQQIISSITFSICISHLIYFYI